MKRPFFLLIQPWIHDFAAYDLWVKPVGLLSFAAQLKKNNCNVQLIDFLDHSQIENREEIHSSMPIRKKTGTGQFIKHEIAKPEALSFVNRKYSKYGLLVNYINKLLENTPRPDAVIITSMMTYWYTGLIETIRLVKDVYPRVPVLLGGVYATVCTQHARMFSGADDVFSGPCNREMLSAVGRYAGISLDWYEDATFSLDYSLLPSKQVIPLVTSRGCPFRCTYCASSVMNPFFEQRNPVDVVTIIEDCIDLYGSQQFAFYDDALLVNPERHILPLLMEIQKRKLPVSFHLPNGIHARNITPAVAEAMKESGFTTLRIGFETDDPELQAETGGKVTCSDLEKAAVSLKAAGFDLKDIGTYVLAGLPRQDAAAVGRAIRFVSSTGLRPLIAEYSPIPGTALWNEAVSCSPFPISTEPLFHNNTLLPCRWEKFTIEDLENLKRSSRSMLISS